MISISVKVDMKPITQALKNMTEPEIAKMLNLCAISLRKSFLQQFKAEGIPERWVPLKESTIERRRKGIKRFNPIVKILQDSGALRRSFTTSNNKGSVHKPMPYKLLIGSSLVYAGTHQFGNSKLNIPKRPLNVLPETIEQMNKIVLNHAKKGLDK